MPFTHDQTDTDFATWLASAPDRGRAARRLPRASSRSGPSCGPRATSTASGATATSSTPATCSRLVRIKWLLAARWAASGQFDRLDPDSVFA